MSNITSSKKPSLAWIWFMIICCFEKVAILTFGNGVHIRKRSFQLQRGSVLGLLRILKLFKRNRVPDFVVLFVHDAMMYFLHNKENYFEEKGQTLISSVWYAWQVSLDAVSKVCSS